MDTNAAQQNRAGVSDATSGPVRAVKWGNVKVYSAVSV